jgi:hypothetical protein
VCEGHLENWTPALWQDTRLRASGDAGLRRFRRWRNWLTGTESTWAGGEEPALQLADLFAGAGGLPFAVLVADAEDTA